MPLPNQRRLPTARERLFELIRQQSVSTTPASQAAPTRALRSEDAARFLRRADRSFGLEQARNVAQPRNPVAITNFSELLARDAGGFTLATLANRCLSSFCNSPSAPPASTFDTKVPPSSRTSNAR